MEGAESNRDDRDSLVALLADRRRRLVWAHMVTAADTVFTLDELAGGVAEQERERGDGPVSEDRRQRVAVELHHRHLPKLESVGVIEYDARSRTVRYRASTLGDHAANIVEGIVAAEP